MHIIIAFLSLIFISLAKITPSWSIDLASHEAYYTLDLIKKENNFNTVTNVRGMILINHERTCDGWIIFENLRMNVRFGDGRSSLQNLQFSGWEPFDGKSYRFAAKGNAPLKTFSLRGFARLHKHGGEVKFLVPQKPIIKIPANTKFPKGFVTFILELARSGKKNITLYFFDGTDGEGPEWIQVSVLGKSNIKLLENLKNEPLLLAKGWRFRITAFQVGNEISDPLYSYEAVFLENGIMAGAILDFEGFKVRQTLKMIKSFGIPQC